LETLTKRGTMTSKQKTERFVLLYDKEKVISLLSDVKVLSSRGEKQDVGEEVEIEQEVVTDAKNVTVSEIVSSSSRSCSYCKTQFESSEDQRIHFKLDWHRYNLKQNLAGKAPVDEENFEQRLNEIENDEDNEISASDDDSENSDDESTSDKPIMHGQNIFFRTQEKVISVNKSLLLDPRSREMPSEKDLVTLLQNAPRRLTWAILMLGGGHFAGAVFRGKEALVHKTFHAYTVRAKQGGNQSSADNKSGSSHPKSAGASLRRYNEMALMQHIQEIMDQWGDHFKQCQLIFYRATSGNKKVLFGSKGSVIEKDDERLRTIPFQTRRATFKEVKRVHELLCRIDICGDVKDFEDNNSKYMKQLEKSPKKIKPHRSKSREDPKRPLPVKNLESDSEESDVGPLRIVEEEISTLGLQEFENSPARRKAQRSKNKTKSKTQKDLDGLELEESDAEEQVDDRPDTVQLQNEMLTAVRSGNNQMLEKLISGQEEVQLAEILNNQFGENKSTLLHLAAKHGCKTVIRTLLLNGADPVVKDKQKKVAYTLAETKDTRNIFRKFMGEFPEKYDYKSAMIPAPLSKEEEEQKQAKQKDKKKAQRDAKREKEKKVKEVEKKVKQEKEEKDRFLNLSDREKRALAAERRLLGESSFLSQVCFIVFCYIIYVSCFKYSL